MRKVLVTWRLRGVSDDCAIIFPVFRLNRLGLDHRGCCFVLTRHGFRRDFCDFFRRGCRREISGMG